jgi:NADH:ubiquinone oxidoreductase subunit D
MHNINIENKRGLAVDIDETLSNTIAYWLEKLQKKFSNPDNLIVKEMVEKYRYTQNIPYYQNSKVLEWIDANPCLYHY